MLASFETVCVNYLNFKAAKYTALSSLQEGCCINVRINAIKIVEPSLNAHYEQIPKFSLNMQLIKESFQCFIISPCPK